MQHSLENSTWVSLAIFNTLSTEMILASYNLDSQGLLAYVKKRFAWRQNWGFSRPILSLAMIKAHYTLLETVGKQKGDELFLPWLPLYNFLNSMGLTIQKPICCLKDKWSQVTSQLKIRSSSKVGGLEIQELRRLTTPNWKWFLNLCRGRILFKNTMKQ